MTHYILADLLVSSSFPLPQLSKASTPHTDEKAHRVVIREGKVKSCNTPTKTFTLLPGGDIYFAVENVARYQLSGGRSITVQVLDENRRVDIPGFLIGSVFGALLHQRGDFPLHAGCIEFEGKAIALTGPSGVGKSTASAALMQRGHRILSDDMIVLRRTDQGFVAVPTVARCKLWQDSLDALQISPFRQLRQSPRKTETGEQPKFECLTQDKFCSEPRPLVAIFHLQPNDFARRANLMNVEQALHSLWSNIYLSGLDRDLGSSNALFQTCALLATTVRQSNWSVAANFNDLPNNITALEKSFRDACLAN